ncbi:hypothetical protein RRG08_022326 [Elysia crispata]|uniref:Uncharacterized protein n=1 Tax=Elysia crispata TaxID=231223 RepID=A0AAE0ZQR1_9GAST|nr:hypothetical protein RRG08_022326 [Elysia crispata]
MGRNVSADEHTGDLINTSVKALQLNRNCQLLNVLRKTLTLMVRKRYLKNSMLSSVREARREYEYDLLTDRTSLKSLLRLPKHMYPMEDRLV